MIRVAVLENDIEYLRQLEQVLSHTEDIQIVYTGGLQNGSIPFLTKIKPDIILMDIDPLKGEGPAKIRQIKKVIPMVQVLIVTRNIQEDSIIGIIKAGASGYILKDDDHKVLLSAIDTIFNGESPLNGRVARTVLSYFTREMIYKSVDDYDLTRREKEIAHLLLKGLAYKDISSQLHISMDTAFSHARKVFEKLGVKSRSELAAKFRAN